MIDAAVIAEDVQRALEEDVGPGDLSANLIPFDVTATATLIAREHCVLAGRPWVEAVFKRISARTHIDWRANDGDQIEANAVIAVISGSARAILTAERTALNFLQTLSATATATRKYVDTVAGTGVKILDTRKTLPGLRRAQKYAVLQGGGSNHRMGLFDAIMIKENHIMAAGSIADAVAAARRQNQQVSIEVEVENLDELQQALEAGVDRILLDNFNLDMLREAVGLNARRARLEASGNVSLETVRAIAETGIDDISIGALTKHVQAIDLSLRFKLNDQPTS